MVRSMTRKFFITGIEETLFILDERDEGVRESTHINQEIKKAEEMVKDLTLNSETDSHTEIVTPTMSHMVVATASTLGMFLNLELK